MFRCFFVLCKRAGVNAAKPPLLSPLLRMKVDMWFVGYLPYLRKIYEGTGTYPKCPQMFQSSPILSHSWQASWPHQSSAAVQRQKATSILPHHQSSSFNVHRPGNTRKSLTISDTLIFPITCPRSRTSRKQGKGGKNALSLSLSYPESRQP